MDNLEQDLYWYQSCEKDMTYILGAKCKDGVVLIGDRKITSIGTGSSDYQDKLFMDVFPMIVGSSGVLGLFEKFRNRVKKYISENQKVEIDTFISEIEKITRELNQSYSSILQGQVFDVLIGVKLQPIGTVLNYIYPIGFSEPVRKYKAIGSGEPHGSIFLKQLLEPNIITNMTMEEVAEIGYFIIKYIEKFELDNKVGVGNNKPQIWFIPDENLPPNPTEDDKKRCNPHQANKELLNKLEENNKMRIEKYPKNLKDFFHSQQE